MRLVGLAVFALGIAAGCAELGFVADGTSVSVGRPSGGYLLDGRRLPDRGEGFTTKDTWRLRGNRWGTDELIDLITAVGRQLAATPGEKLVVADLSSIRGGESRKWHRSHQSGRDVDLVYFMRDKDGKPMEADAMRVFDANGLARDGSGVTIDIPRTWELVRALLTAREATVQWIFMYQPIANKLLEHALAKGEPDYLIARAQLVMKQPGDSARHDDHMHVRVYCSQHDRELGCIDIGPMAPLQERIAAREYEGDLGGLVEQMLAGAAQLAATEVLTGR